MRVGNLGAVVLSIRGTSFQYVGEVFGCTSTALVISRIYCLFLINLVKSKSDLFFRSQVHCIGCEANTRFYQYSSTVLMYCCMSCYTIYSVYNSYLLAPWSRDLENPTGSQLVKTFLSFYETRRFITAFKSTHLTEAFVNGS